MCNVKAARKKAISIICEVSCKNGNYFLKEIIQSFAATFFIAIWLPDFFSNIFFFSPVVDRERDEIEECIDKVLFEENYK